MIDIFYKRARLSGLPIEDVTLVKAERITIHVRFRGGQTTSMEIDKPTLLSSPGACDFFIRRLSMGGVKMTSARWSTLEYRLVDRRTA